VSFGARADTASQTALIASQLVAARLSGTALSAFPGPIPPTLADSYACQEAAIALWPDEVVGWKVGRIPPALQATFNEERLAGPVFRKDLRPGVNGPVEFGVFVGGFSAVEAEFVYRLSADAPAGKLQWSEDEALALADALFIGIETAGSPMADINEQGPLVVASDFGNNAGLILGAEIESWRGRSYESLACETFVDGASVGRGSAASLPGGPAAALAFLLGHCAARGRPLTKGMLVSTGAATGIHQIEAGQTARADFGDLGQITCTARPATPA